MKSTQRSTKPPKQPKPNNQTPKLDLVAYNPVEQHQEISKPSPSEEPPPVEELQVIVDDQLAAVEPQAEPQAMPLTTFSTNADDKPLPSRKVQVPTKRTAGGNRFSSSDKANRSLNSTPQAKPQAFESHDEDVELPPERCQHMKFMDCDQPVGRIIFECYHCQQGILSEFTGEPMMGEYKGRPTLIQVEVQCPSCEQTAIRLTTGEVLSTTAIASPWA